MQQIPYTLEIEGRMYIYSLVYNNGPVLGSQSNRGSGNALGRERGVTYVLQREELVVRDTVKLLKDVLPLELNNDNCLS